ncbi:MAG: hypothetical protein WD766_06465 [Gemmatimonadota bacterium]
MRGPQGLVAAAMLVLTFAVGGLAGMAVEEALGLDWFDFLDEDSQTDTRVLSGLELSADQSAAIDRILDRQEDRLESYWENRVPDLRAIVADSYEEIRGVLTAQQRQVFDERVEAQGIPVPRAD